MKYEPNITAAFAHSPTLAERLARIDAICGRASNIIRRTQRIVDRVLPPPSYANWHWADRDGFMDRSRRCGERQELARQVQRRLTAKMDARFGRVPL